jgi:hypothetical protein
VAELENVEVALMVCSRFPKKLSVETVLGVLKRKVLQSELCSKEIEFIASHFEVTVCTAPFSKASTLTQFPLRNSARRARIGYLQQCRNCVSPTIDIFVYSTVSILNEISG